MSLLFLLLLVQVLCKAGIRHDGVVIVPHGRPVPLLQALLFLLIIRVFIVVVVVVARDIKLVVVGLLLDGLLAHRHAVHHLV
ncbi:hypothetical protein TPAR_01481, partial [Tolypocladium paradoxum]